MTDKEFISRVESLLAEKRRREDPVQQLSNELWDAFDTAAIEGGKYTSPNTHPSDLLKLGRSVVCYALAEALIKNLSTPQS